MIPFLGLLSGGLGKNVIVALAVAVAVAGIFGTGYGVGSTRATKAAAEDMAEYKDEVHRREQQQAALILEANNYAAELEKKHAITVADLRTKFAKANERAVQRDANTIARLRTGAERLRLAVSACHSTRPGDPPAASAGVDGDGRGELTPEASEALWRIAADGDRAVRKLTALQEWAREAVRLCGVSPS